MASTKFYLDCRGKAADGKGSVLIQIFHNKTMTSVPTKIRVKPSEWNGTQVVKTESAESINAILNEQKSKLDKAIAVLSFDDRFSMMSAADIKHEITDGKPKHTGGHLMSDMFEEYMETGNLKESTKDIYHLALKKVLSFGGASMRIESINHKWLRAFDKYLSETQSPNGKAIYLRCLKAICNDALHSKIITYYPFENFHIKYEETKKRCITIEKLREFYYYPTSKKNAYYRDYFFLMFFLIGINTIDLLTAKKDQVKNGRLEYTRSKTGKHYSIKIEPEADILLKKYEGKGDYLLEALDHCKSYKNFGRGINDAIKLIGPEIEEDILVEEAMCLTPVSVMRTIPVVSDITTYYARHTWSTLAHELDISSDIIAMALGHSPTNRTTFIYIKPDKEKVDIANRKMIDFLLNIKRV